MESCIYCGHRCGVNRKEGKEGVCRSGILPRVSSFSPHFGEERELVGIHGSGTIFFSNCNLKCLFCQNYTLSHFGEGEVISISKLADIMLYLQRIKCHNINFVSPTHFVYPILQAIEEARKKGLRLPIVYNTGGYDSKETIELLEGVVDIYMPDAKYSDDNLAQELSGAKGYVELNQQILKLMQQQVGNLVIENGIAKKGLLIRHLVLPGYLENSYGVLDFIRQELGPNTFVNIMAQYYPCYLAHHHPILNRPLYYSEYEKVVNYARKIGLKRGFPLGH